MNDCVECLSFLACEVSKLAVISLHIHMCILCIPVVILRGVDLIFCWTKRNAAYVPVGIQSIGVAAVQCKIQVLESGRVL